MKISCNFDGGAIETVAAEDFADIRLRIRADSKAEFRQWFYFRLQGAGGHACRMLLTNAGECTYVNGWRDYRAVASYDRTHWFRVPTGFDGAALAIEHTPEKDSVYYAYFEPYSFERHLDLLARIDRFEVARVSDLGSTIDGRDLNLVTVGASDAQKKPLWIMARQHPGETMGQWCIEGMLERLVDRSDPIARTLLAGAVVYVVPNMNPDGGFRGNLRTNAAGANLNREWLEPTLTRSPEVFHVRRAMHETGVQFLLDVHGDEALPYVFVDGCEMLPSFTPAHAARQKRFTDALRRASPDFQTEVGYPRNNDTKVNLTLAAKYAGHAFDCLSLTLELPFKDNANLPDATFGWNGARSKRLGAALLEAMLETLPDL